MNGESDFGAGRTLVCALRIKAPTKFVFRAGKQFLSPYYSGHSQVGFIDMGLDDIPQAQAVTVSLKELTEGMHRSYFVYLNVVSTDE